MVGSNEPSIQNVLAQLKYEEECGCNYWDTVGKYDYSLLNTQGALNYMSMEVGGSSMDASTEIEWYGGQVLEILTFFSYLNIEHPDSPPIIAFLHEISSNNRIHVFSSESEVSYSRRYVGNIRPIELNEEMIAQFLRRGLNDLIVMIRNPTPYNDTAMTRTVLNAVRLFSRGIYAKSDTEKYVNYYSSLEVLLRILDDKTAPRRLDDCICALLSLNLSLPRRFNDGRGDIGAVLKFLAGEDDTMANNEFDLQKLKIERAEVLHGGKLSVHFKNIDSIRDLAFQCIGTVLQSQDLLRDKRNFVNFLKAYNV
ncbi:MAG: hypothetical protein R3F46_08685 [bacterium]